MKYINEDRLRNLLKENENKVPIYKGCPNHQCFCTGECKEIIGYREKTNLEKMSGNSFYKLGGNNESI